MSTFKCKMCGGALEINNNDTVVTCEYCGTQQTLPKLDDEKRANMYDRANHFRRNNEFDKAMGIYEQILNEDSTDAEAYWSLVLCRYGIEYVEDPSSHKRIPTVNRAQFTSIFDDSNYKSALEYADTYQKAIYESEAKAINEIQKGILAISQKEEPFDVFICYKETDSTGRRTHDSVLANDLYHQLTQEGFKVFFSRITLEDKLGTAYEPYIFAALNSSKVMVVLGTKTEFFNAVWVKNEWSRYLSLIKNGADKLLIPAYRDMDPYDLPEEFSHLQAQDMSKLGFMQDLIRGIKKIVHTDEPTPTVVKETVIKETSTPTQVSSTEPLLKRVFMFLEDGNWESADEYCEKVLDLDPENAYAYLGKLMASNRVRKQDHLKNLKLPFDKILNSQNPNYQKAMRFGDEKLRKALAGYIEHINTRNENERCEGIYLDATNKMNSAKSENEFREAANLFDKIKSYKDSTNLVQKCRQSAKRAHDEAVLKAENERKDDILRRAKNKMKGDVIKNHEEALELLKTISGWKDADVKFVECQKRIDLIKSREERLRIEEENRIQREKEALERKKKRNIKIAIITTPVVCAVIAFIIVLNTFIIPNAEYNRATVLMNDAKYEEALVAFDKLDGYKDSKTKMEECYKIILDGKYDKATILMNDGKYQEAIAFFDKLEGHKDSKSKINECYTLILESEYNDAISMLNNGNIIGAYDSLMGLDGYKDSFDKANSIYKQYIIEKLKLADVGDYIDFGKYEQDNNIDNGKEDISWELLDKKNNRVLLISERGLECKPYNERKTDITWELCTLRKWLNNDFIDTAFSETEKSMIPLVMVSADKNRQYNANPGNPTMDKVFCLSTQEAVYYSQSTGTDLLCWPTIYAEANGVKRYGSDCSWWLRTPGRSEEMADEWTSSSFNVGEEVNSDNNAVRPALWINLES